MGQRAARPRAGMYRNARFTAAKYGALALPADVKRLATETQLHADYAEDQVSSFAWNQ